jgi:hypothetical protein
MQPFKCQQTGRIPKLVPPEYKFRALQLHKSTNYNVFDNDEPTEV